MAQKRIDLNDALPGSVLFRNIPLQAIAESLPFRNLSGDVAELSPGAGLFIHLDLLRQSGNSAIEGGYVIGLAHQRVQPGMYAACGSIDKQAVLIDKYAALECIHIEVEQCLPGLIRRDSSSCSRIQVDDFHRIKARRFPKGTGNTIPHALGFEIEGAAVSACQGR